MSIRKFHGVVEGFYWRSQHMVNNRYKEYDHIKRDKLLKFMAYKGLTVYVYDPKELRGNNYQRAWDKELIGNYSNWKETFEIAKRNKIDFLWGIAPGRKETWHNKPLRENMDLLLKLGVKGFIFLFDDVAGGSTDSEKKHQIELLNSLAIDFPIYAICPGNYSGTRERLEDKLAIFDENLIIDIDLIVTGAHTWNGIISYDKLPHFKNRKTWYWDNWMASDTNSPERLFLKPPKCREQSVFKECRGYLLNPCFPVERIVPMISAIGEIANGFTISDEGIYEYNDRLPELIEVMADDWSYFLDIPSEILLKLIRRHVFKSEDIITQKEIELVRCSYPSLVDLIVYNFGL